jgi:peptide/nickel transport system substrate-binding protein
VPSRRGWLVLAIAAMCFALAAVPFSFSAAASSANENARTLDLALPGPFSACTYLDQDATPTSDAILDLIRPSAFVTASNGVLVGEDGAISSAELTSLSPETVRYTIAPKMVWSDGAAFTGANLVNWWVQARTLASVTSDGYRAIKSLVVSKNGLTVTAVFATPYADWDLLFRDVEAPGITSTSCALSNLLTRPSLGPYYVERATPDRLVLDMNPAWPLDPNRFGRVVITDSQDLPSASTVNFADYSMAVNRATVLTLSTKSALSSKIASSSNIEELTFSPRAATTNVLGIREALSWSVQRQALIDTLFGAVTYSPSVAASAIFSQGQADYPGGAGSNPVGQTTTTTTPPTNTMSDCVTCAVAVLKTSGYVRTSAGWVNSAGKRLHVQLGVGPSTLDHAAALLVKADWAAIGISSTIVDEKTEISAAEASALGRVDVSLFARPTTTTPAYAASSWAGPAYPNSYPSGVRSPTVTAFFDQATAIFNPVTASSTWLKLDQTIMTDFWVRPLFTAPTLTIWSTPLSSVANSFTVAGFVDQLPTWSRLPSTTTS